MMWPEHTRRLEPHKLVHMLEHKPQEQHRPEHMLERQREHKQQEQHKLVHRRLVHKLEHSLQQEQHRQEHMRPERQLVHRRRLEQHKLEHKQQLVHSRLVRIRIPLSHKHSSGSSLC
jgi:hypothetical protein